jgi:hypothetical protein
MPSAIEMKADLARRPLFAVAFFVLCEEGIEQPLPVVEGRRFEALESRGEVDQPAPRREIEHTQRARYGKTEPPCRRHPVLIIHQHETGVDRERQFDRGALAGIQFWRRQVVAVYIGIRVHLQPGGRLPDPGTYRCRCLAIGEFIAHHLRRQHPREQFGQQLDIAGQRQVVKRPGIGNGQQRDAPSETEPLQIAAVALQILGRIGSKDFVRGEKFIKPPPCFKTEQPAQLGAAQMPLAELIKRQRFEHPALDRAGSAEEARELVGDADGDFGVGADAGRGVVVHILFLSRGRVSVKFCVGSAGYQASGFGRYVPRSTTRASTAFTP